MMVVARRRCRNTPICTDSLMSQRVPQDKLSMASNDDDNAFGLVEVTLSTTMLKTRPLGRILSP